MIWHDIKRTWNITDETRKNKLMSRMGYHFRKFKQNLVKDFVRTGRTPFMKYNWLTEKQWVTFVKYHESEEFKVLSRRGKENQAKNVHPHYLGSRGYDGAEFKKQLKASQ